jgi:hypothetical protein
LWQSRLVWFVFQQALSASLLLPVLRQALVWTVLVVAAAGVRALSLHSSIFWHPVPVEETARPWPWLGSLIRMACS